MERTVERRLMKADLHLHSWYSGLARHLGLLRCRDSYSRPEQIYRRAKARGMDLVTITDHDSIEGCLELLSKHPELDDFFISEEISCSIPDMGGHCAHINAFDIDEETHREVQRLRGNIYDVVSYLREGKVLFSLNHMFHNFKTSIPVQLYIERMLALFDVFEGRSGAMSSPHDQLVWRIVMGRSGGAKKSLVAGSDAHTLRRVGATYTAAVASSKAEFFQKIRSGETILCGRHGGALAIAGDIYGVVLSYYPNIAKFWTDEFSLPVRLRNMILSLMVIPFLGTPLLIAVRYALNQKSILDEIYRSLP